MRRKDPSTNGRQTALSRGDSSPPGVDVRGGRAENLAAASGRGGAIRALRSVERPPVSARGFRAAEAPDESGGPGPWREGNDGALSPHSGGSSDPDAESENRDQEGQRDGEKDEVDRRYASIDDGRGGRFRGPYDIAPATCGECGAGTVHGRHRRLGEPSRRVGRRDAREPNLRCLTTDATLWLRGINLTREAGNDFPFWETGKTPSLTQSPACISTQAYLLLSFQAGR